MNLFQSENGILKTLLTTFLLFLATGKSAALAGGESSAGGADDYQILPAFFIDWPYSLKPVKVCQQISRNFGIDPQSLEEIIRDSFQSWGNYLHTHHLDDLLPGSSRIRTQVEFLPTCDGTEELKFYFGVINDEVLRFKSEFNQPFGFAALTHRWPNRGFVWIAPPESFALGNYPGAPKVPNWSPSTQPALAALVLHEVGHVFGNGHVDGTVMTPAIGRYLETDTDRRRTRSFLPFYSTIDSQIALILCLECAENFEAAPSFDEISHADSDWDHSFTLLTGRPPVPPLSIRFERQFSNSGTSGYRYPGSGELVMSDASETFRFAVEVQTQAGMHLDSTHLFEGQGGTYFNSSAVSFFGFVRARGETRIPVAIDYNMDGVKAKILPLGDGLYTRPLFVSEHFGR